MSNKRYKRNRCKTLAFTQSDLEKSRLNNLVYLSGMKKQDYIVHRLLGTEVVAIPDVKVQKHILIILKEIEQQIEESLKENKPLQAESREIINVIGLMLEDMKGEIKDETGDY